MKKLNNKGFTLIELLAIIVILAIIMVVTIPTVLSSMGTAREDMFQNSTNSVADWVEKQYSSAMLQNADTVFTDVCTSAKKYCATKVTLTARSPWDPMTSTNYVAFLKAAGVKPSNYSGVSVQIINGRACVILTASNTGDFATYKGTKKSSTGC